MENKEKLFGREDCGVMRALVTVSTEEGYDFECMAVPSDNKQLKYSWENDEYFYQVLRTGIDNIVLDRLESGLNLFDNHPYDLSAMKTLGISKSYDVTEAGLSLKIKLGARADDALRKDIQDGVLKTVSIEGEVRRYNIVREAGQVPIYYADLWEPTSVSLAPVPQDIAAQVNVKRALDAQLHKKESFIDLLTKNF